MRKPLLHRRDRDRSAGTSHFTRDDRVGSGYVRRSATAAETSRARNGWIVVSPSVLTSEWVGEVGMIQDVKEFGTELRAETLREFPVLGGREIPVVEAAVAKEVAGHGSECSHGGRNHYRVPLCIAAERCQRIQSSTCGCIADTSCRSGAWVRGIEREIRNRVRS